MDLTIIQATHEYKEECKEAFLDSVVGEHYSELISPLKSFYDEGIERGEIYVAQDKSGSFLGFLWFLLTGTFYHFPYLRQIAVKKEFRNKGVGSELLDFFEEKAFQRSSKIFLLVSDFNEKAKKFYVSNGYKEVGKLKDPFIPGTSEYIMMKSK